MDARPLITVQGLPDVDMATDQSSTDVMTAPVRPDVHAESANKRKADPAYVAARSHRVAARSHRIAALMRRSAELRLRAVAFQDKRLRTAAIRAAYGIPEPDLKADYPELRILRLTILSPGRPDIVLSVPENGNPQGVWFTLKEGSEYSLKFTFQVNNNTVDRLSYTNSVWKSGFKLDRTKEFLGKFSPQSEPYNHVTTPSGMFAPGSYSARTKFRDGHHMCYLEINYSFDICEEWPAEEMNKEENIGSSNISANVEGLEEELHSANQRKDDPANEAARRQVAARRQEAFLLCRSALSQYERFPYRQLDPETLYPEVRILSLTILSPGRPDIVLSVPENGNPQGVWFTLKEGSNYNFKFTFQVNKNIVSGLSYTHTVWKSGFKLHSRGREEMLGTFSHQSEPYNYVMAEETTPSGMFAAGSYSARTKFRDDDYKCHWRILYSFDIRE